MVTAKIRIPNNQIEQFKEFCKVFSRLLQSEHNIRLRGNILLNLMARSCCHDSYTALLIDAKTYGNSHLLKDRMICKMHAYLQNEIGIDAESLRDLLDRALQGSIGSQKESKQSFDFTDLFYKADKTEGVFNRSWINIITPSMNENKYFSDRAIAFLNIILPALSELKNKGVIKITPSVIAKIITLPTLTKLASNHIEIGGVHYQNASLSKKTVEAISKYLNSIPGYDHALALKNLPEEAARHLGFIEGYISKSLRHYTTISRHCDLEPALSQCDDIESYDEIVINIEIDELLDQKNVESLKRFSEAVSYLSGLTADTIADNVLFCGEPSRGSTQVLTSINRYLSGALSKNLSARTLATRALSNEHINFLRTLKDRPTSNALYEACNGRKRLMHALLEKFSGTYFVKIVTIKKVDQFNRQFKVENWGLIEPTLL